MIILFLPALRGSFLPNAVNHSFTHVEPSRLERRLDACRNNAAWLVHARGRSIEASHVLRAGVRDALPAAPGHARHRGRRLRRAPRPTGIVTGIARRMTA
jgi:hypothetical protein